MLYTKPRGSKKSAIWGYGTVRSGLRTFKTSKKKRAQRLRNWLGNREHLWYGLVRSGTLFSHYPDEVEKPQLEAPSFFSGSRLFLPWAYRQALVLYKKTWKTMFPRWWTNLPTFYAVADSIFARSLRRPRIEEYGFTLPKLHSKLPLLGVCFPDTVIIRPRVRLSRYVGELPPKFLEEHLNHVYSVLNGGALGFGIAESRKLSPKIDTVLFLASWYQKDASFSEQDPFIRTVKLSEERRGLRFHSIGRALKKKGWILTKLGVLTSHTKHQFFLTTSLVKEDSSSMTRVWSKVNPKLKADISVSIAPRFHQVTLFRITERVLLRLNEELIEAESGGSAQCLQFLMSLILSNLTNATPMLFIFKTPWMVRRKLSLTSRSLQRSKLYPEGVDCSFGGNFFMSTFLVSITNRVHTIRKRLRSLPRRSRKKLAKLRVGRIFLGKVK